ncbi:MAG TPA: hypothetical protein VGG33_28090, partial [Polyangia bacterium]
MLAASDEVVDSPPVSPEPSQWTKRNVWSLVGLTIVALLTAFGWQILSYLSTRLPLPLGAAATAILVVVILYRHAGLWRPGETGQSQREAMRVRPLNRLTGLLIVLAVP